MCTYLFNLIFGIFNVFNILGVNSMSSLIVNSKNFIGGRLGGTTCALFNAMVKHKRKVYSYNKK